MPVITRLLQIHSENPKTRRRGRQLQVLLALLLLLTIVYSLWQISQHGPFSPATVRLLVLAGAFNLLATILSFVIVRTGRVLQAAHLYFLSFNTLLLAFMIGDPANAASLGYLLLVSVVAITFIHNFQASLVYSVLFISLAAIYLRQINEPVAPFLIVSATLTATAWLSALALQRNLAAAAQLAAELQDKSANLEQRLLKLSLSAEVGQVATASLDMEQLMRATVGLIRNQFGFYHVAIYLLDKTGRNAVIRESTGKIGDLLKSRRHSVPISNRSTIGLALATKRVQLIADTHAIPDYQPNPLLPDTRSEVVLPLSARGETLGCLNVHSQQENAFREEDVAILQLMANQIASSLDNARLFGEIQRRLNETEAVFSMISMLTTTLDVGEIYRRAARVFTEQLRATRCAVSSWERLQNTLITQAEYVHDLHGTIVEGYDPSDQGGPYDLALHQGTRWVLEKHEPLIRYVDDPSLEEAERKILLEDNHAISLEVPMVFGDRALGTVELYRDAGQVTFSRAEIQLTQAMANQVATALNNAILATEARSRAAQMSTLNRVSHILSTANDFATVCQGARQEIFSLTEATGMSILLLTEDKEHLRWVYAFEYGRDIDLSDQIFPTSERLSGYVARTREPLFINEAFEEHLTRLQGKTVGSMASAWLGLPLIVVNELIGVLVVENADDPEAFSETDVQLLTIMSGPLAIAINNLRQLETIRASQQMTEELYQAGRRINLSETVPEVLSALIRPQMLDETGRASIFLFSEPWGHTRPGQVTLAASWPDNTSPARQTYKLVKFPVLAVLERERPITIADAANDVLIDPAGYLALAGSEERRSFTAIPLLAGDDWIGFLAIFSTAPLNLDTSEAQQLLSLSRQAATTIQNQRLLQQTREALLSQSELTLQLQTAAEVSAAASTILNVDELMDQAVNLIQQRFNLYHVGILLVNPAGNSAILRAATGQAGRSLIAQQFSVPVGSRSLVGSTIADGTPRIAQDVQKSQEWQRHESLPNTRSEVALPLRVRNRIIGALSVQSAQPNDFSAELIQVLQTMCDQLAVAIDNAELLAQTEGRARQQQRLNQISAQLHRSADVDTIVALGLKAIAEHLGGSEVRLILGQGLSPAGEATGNGHAIPEEA